MKYLFSVLSILLAFGCSSKSTGKIPNSSSCSQLKKGKGAPTILIIGDSISEGYLPTLVSDFASFDVVRNPCNAKWTDWTLSRIDGWLAGRSRFEAITFNNGLWDVADWIGTSDEKYAQNLRQIALKVKSKTDRPLFILTTEILQGTPNCHNAEVIRKNQIAMEVMGELGIPVMDLYSVSVSIRDEHVNPTDLHYTKNGSRILGEAIAEELRHIYGL